MFELMLDLLHSIGGSAAVVSQKFKQIFSKNLNEYSLNTSMNIP